MFIARKISSAKWLRRSSELAEGEISADAVTADLRTKLNTLSFWRCGSGASGEVESAALAIAAAADRIDKVELVWLSDGELLADGQTLEDSLGRTPVLDLVDRHVDMSRLDMMRLGQLATRVAEALAERQCRRLTKRQVKSLLMDALEQNRIVPAQLSRRIREELTA